MTRKTDMSSRYAAAHARREQRRRQGPARDFLPLAESGTTTIDTDGTTRTERNRAAAPVASRLPVLDYAYLRGDLMRIATLAIILFAAMIILHFFVH